MTANYPGLLPGPSPRCARNHAFPDSCFRQSLSLSAGSFAIFFARPIAVSPPTRFAP